MVVLDGNRIFPRRQLLNEVLNECWICLRFAIEPVDDMLDLGFDHAKPQEMDERGERSGRTCWHLSLAGCCTLQQLDVVHVLIDVERELFALNLRRPAHVSSLRTSTSISPSEIAGGRPRATDTPRSR